jgi:hypothetical protein
VLALTEVYRIRRWGTPGEGIGYLAVHGPTDTTTVDLEPNQLIDRIQVIRAIPCNATADAAWRKILTTVAAERR